MQLKESGTSLAGAAVIFMVRFSLLGFGQYTASGAARPNNARPPDFLMTDVWRMCAFR